MTYFLGFLLVVTSVFMIMLVLVQRGRGGGLTGALGGAGGQSALGTKAGDMFTRITMGTAVFWIMLCIVSLKVFNRAGVSQFGDFGVNSPATQPADKPNKSEGTPGENPLDKPGSAPPATPAGETGKEKPAGTDATAAKPAASEAPAAKPAAPEAPAAPPAPKSSAPASETPAPNPGK